MSSRSRTILGTFVVSVLLAVFGLGSTPRPASAQVVGGSIGGTATDETAAALPGVTITVTNTANGVRQVVTTGERGNYRAVALAPSRYLIVAELSGFASLKREVVLTIGGTAGAAA